MEWQRFHNILRMLNWLVLLCFALASYFSMGPFWTTGVLLRGLIAIVNFTVLQHTVRRAFSLRESTKARGFPSWGNTIFDLSPWV